MAATRIHLIDQLRGIAIAAMVTYHFTWDLEYFRYVDPGSATAGPMKWFARAVASSFLILAGVGLVLAHRQDVNWRAFGRRFAVVGGAAMLISIGTWFSMGAGFIFFGILHQITVGSLIALLFLRLPLPALLLAASAMVAAPHFLRNAVFDAPIWWWLGLSTIAPPSNDYVPVLPWTGMILIGVAVAKYADDRGWFPPRAQFAGGPKPVVGKWLGLAGRHSLIIYLVHQPFLISCVYLFSLLSPAASMDVNGSFAAACKANCELTYSPLSCEAFCSCVKVGMVDAELLDEVTAGKTVPQSDPAVMGIVNLCAAQVNQNGQ